MSDQATLPVSRNAISSPGLASGRTRFVPPGGEMIDLFGQGVARVSHLVPQEKERE